MSLHIRQAAKWHHIPYHVFRELPIEDQAAYVAHYEAIITLEALDADDQQKRMEG